MAPFRRRPRFRFASPNQSRQNALTASGQRIRKRDGDGMRRLIQPWQSRALGYYDDVPEIKYAAQFYSRAMSVLDLYVGEMVDDELVPSENEEVIAYLDRVQDPGGGRSQLQSSYGRLRFLTGEAYLLASTDDETDEEKWEMLSSDELRVTGSGYTRYSAPSMPAENLREAPDEAYAPLGKDQAVVYRLWNRHPRYSLLADATMRGVLDVCVAKGTMISTNRGPIPVEEVTPNDHVFTWTAGGLDMHPIARHIERGTRDVLKITAGRRTIRATAEHPLLRMRKSRPGKGHRADYDLEWVEAGGLEVGDHLVALDHVYEYGVPQVLPDGTQITEDIAWLLGQIVGDGHVHAEGVNIAVFNDERRERIAAIMLDYFGLSDHPQGGSARFYSRSLRNLLSSLGLRVKSHRKGVPPQILASPLYVKRAFLDGYEEADGHLTRQGWQSLALTSERLARELRALYIELGENVSNFSVEERAPVMHVAGNEKPTLNAKPLHRFQVYYGSRRHGKTGLLQAADAVEKIGGQHFTISTVKRIEPDGVARTYDLEVEGAHNYIADGIVSHNCEELVLLTQAVRARARSRLAGSGILLVNGDVTPVSIDRDAADENPEDDPFIDDLTEAMTQPIVDEGAASAVVPFVVRVDGVDKDQGGLDNVMKHLQIVDPTQLYPETGLRREAIERLAIGLDMPPEVLLGIANANHWTGWMIDEQTWKGHLQPVAQGFVDDLNGAYFRPSLREGGITDWERYYIAYDATKIINHPDRSKDAKDLYALRAIGKRALREAGGFDEEDAPTEEELNEMIGVECRDSSLAVTGIPAPRGTLGLEVAPGELVGGKDGGTIDGGKASSEAPKAPPTEPPQTDKPTSGTVVGTGQRLIVDRILGASDLMLVRAREIAGARLRNYAKRNPEALKAIDGVPARQVAAVLGREQARALGAPADRDLVAGGRDLLATAIRLARLDEAFADPLGERIEQHAARTLYDDKSAPLSQQFANYVAGLVSGTESSDG